MSAARSTLRSSAPRRVLDGFGRAQFSSSRYLRPADIETLAEVLARARDEGMPVTFRGAGRSYGDASLNRDGLVLDLRDLNRMRSWDPLNGVIDLEAGVSIEGVWRRTIEDGWWPAVVPGTMHPTLGGCVSMNIHGKNCFRVGPFGDQVLELDLLTVDGELRTLSRTREPELFHAVIAGLGLLGAVTRVRLKLKHVESGLLRVTPMRSRNFAEMFDQFEQHLPDADYLVGWVDCFASGTGRGRGLVHRADYLPAHEDPAGPESLHVERQGLPGNILGVPRGLIWRFMQPLMNDTGMRFTNTLKYYAPETWGSPDGTYLQSHVAFAFLLDYVPDWRLAYGDRGFIQYQVFLPDATARVTMPQVLQQLHAAGHVPFLGVFKRHKPDPFLLSHGLDGWSLALDLPAGRGGARDLDAALREVTARVLDAGGTFYAAKDSVIDGAAFARAYGERVDRFLAIKRQLDPGGVLVGDQARRLMPQLERAAS